MNFAVNNPTLTDLLASLRPDVAAQLDVRCPEQDLHRLIIIAENTLMEILQSGSDAGKRIDQLCRLIQRLFNVRIRLTDLQDRLRIRQQREDERREAKRLKEQQKEEEKQRKQAEKKAQKEMDKEARESAKFNAWRKKPFFHREAAPETPQPQSDLKANPADPSSGDQINRDGLL